MVVSFLSTTILYRSTQDWKEGEGEEMRKGGSNRRHGGGGD